MLGDLTRGLTADELLDAVAEAVVVVDAQGTIVWANRRAEQIMGRAREGWIGSSGLALIHPDDLHLAALSLGTITDKEVGSPIEVRVATHDGWRLTEVIGAPLGDGRVVLSMRDLTQRRRWEVAGNDVARFRSLVQNSSALTMLVRSDGTVTSVSAAITRLLGHDPEDTGGKPLALLVAGDDRPAVETALRRAVTGASSASAPTVVEVSLLTSDGRTVPYELSIVSLLDDPTVEGLVVSGHDITRLRAAQDSLAELANFDALTGLPNRRSFLEELDRQWDQAHRERLESYVLVADLDGFKGVNDRHGHAAGDEALRHFSRALRLAVRETDVVGRLGGDEFGVILTRCGSEQAAWAFGPRLRALIAERPLGFVAEIDATVGHASLGSSPSPAAALHAADLAMLAAKRVRR